jgi:DNA mismatch repair protein MutL
MIRILPKDISDKIAAGEVVDRPVSVLKELLENAVDAGARSITAEIRDGGKSYLRVTDDGSGIPAEEVALAFHRHATSKITEAEDLDRIRTLGFRGEALASIAAVARVEVITKTRDQKTGSRTILEGGELLSQTPTGCPDGTSIIVRDLFFNTPARLKFLKTDATEASLILECFSQMALAYPGIRFRMIQQGRTLFATSGDGDVLRAVKTLYPSLPGDALLAFTGEESAAQVRGFLSDPGETRPNRRYQQFYVNGRIVASKLLERSLDTAYGRKAPEGRHPVVFLFLEVLPEHLDVNIHPNKREVRFHDERAVAAFVTRTLEAALNQPSSIPTLKPAAPRPGERSAPHAFKAQTETSKALETHQYDIKNILSTLRESVVEQGESQVQGKPADQTRKGFAEAESAAAPQTENRRPASDAWVPPAPEAPMSREQASAPAGKPPFDLEDLRLLGIVFETYLLAADGEQLYLVDQHAAHERILYEEILDGLTRQGIPSQQLMVPFSIEMGFAAPDQPGGINEILARIGFEAAPFGPRTYLIQAIPGQLGLSEAELFLRDFLDGLAADTQLSDAGTLERAAAKACKAAVKARDRLSNEEQRHLLERLTRCADPYACPHGRPVFVRITRDEITRRFRRV